MKKILLLLCTGSILMACKNDQDNNQTPQEIEIDTLSAAEEIDFKVLDSKYINNDTLWAPFENHLDEFSSEVYEEVKALVFEKSILEIQNAVASEKLSYEDIVLFYLTRIREYDRNNEYSLNSVISINPDIIKEAKEKDRLRKEREIHPIYGIPVLLKDNINTEAMATTAGAEALRTNSTSDAFIVERLKSNGALILGKANLSEWAYFFCEDCPSGYSAIGGQTLNPYGRKILDTGGSSSGSGVAVAANLAPAAVGSETSGSILSPSSQNSIVGLKPTIGLLSRSGIVPISITLDTPGPMTRSVMDNAILLSAMSGLDIKDPASVKAGKKSADYYKEISKIDLTGKRFGAIRELLKDTLYVRAINDLKNAGASIIEFDAEELDLPGFVRLLNLDMKKDLPSYFKSYAEDLPYKNVQDIVKYNLQDSLNRAPYGQELFLGIIRDSATPVEFATIKDTLRKRGTRFFEKPMKEYDLDAVLSINNYHASFAAVAQYPAITVPMGYTTDKNKPMGLTFIGRPFSEQNLLNWAYVYEQTTKRRKTPTNYDE